MHPEMFANIISYKRSIHIKRDIIVIITTSYE